MNGISIYQDISSRTDGNIYIGVVGPVRTGKSTFIKKFMETMVIPNIENDYARERAKDELPQSGSGKTIMTSEPKFVPESSVDICLDNTTCMSVRLIDCVGYMVDGASGQFEDGGERMVTTPWFSEEVSITKAAEEGTRKVIAEHSTIGLVVTCDGSICGIERDSYVEVEERVIGELKAIGKPFAILLNSSNPKSEYTLELRDSLAEKHGVSCIAVNCQELELGGIEEIMSAVLAEFPLTDIKIHLPSWIEALDMDYPLKNEIYTAILTEAKSAYKMRDAYEIFEVLSQYDNIMTSKIESIAMGTGEITAKIEVPRSLYYETISEQSGLDIKNDGDLMELLCDMRDIKKDYERISGALQDVREKGYGVVMPSADEIVLEDPEIVKRGGKYSVKLKASAPSIHMLQARVETEVTPALGGEKASDEILSFLLQGFDGDTSKIWDSNIFGKSLYDIAEEGILSKVNTIPENTQRKLQNSVKRIMNEGGGLICIII